jgi:hypothetical protein
MPTISSVYPTALNAIDGGTITITGTYFGWTTTFFTYVQCGGVTYSFPFVTNTQIVVSLPASASGIYTLYLAWGSGPYISLTYAITYNFFLPWRINHAHRYSIRLEHRRYSVHFTRTTRILHGCRRNRFGNYFSYRYIDCRSLRCS